MNIVCPRPTPPRSPLAETIRSRSIPLAWPTVAGSPHATPSPVSALKWTTSVTTGPMLPAFGTTQKGPIYNIAATLMRPHPVAATKPEPKNPIHPERTGPLRKGNPRSNPNAASRCGAKTRTGCPCRSPAMKNGKCRKHGGASTGLSTEGRARTLPPAPSTAAEAPIPARTPNASRA